jgi:glycosyltransferase involved in cell wall biosynthesis
LYARMFDVGLNPRVVNKLSLAMNPVKLLEYLSLGMPVVSTDLPAVRKFQEYVYIAKTQEHFIELIADALQDTSTEKRNARKKLSLEYSWEAIVESISETILRIDRKKRSSKNEKV